MLWRLLRSWTVEAIEAAAVEAIVAIEAVGSLQVIKTTIKSPLKIDFFASEASHVCHRNKNKKVFGIRFFRERSEPRLPEKPTEIKIIRFLELDSFASEASHVYKKVRPLASEASPSARSAQPPAGLARRSGAAGAETGLRVSLIKLVLLKQTHMENVCIYNFRPIAF